MPTATAPHAHEHRTGTAPQPDAGEVARFQLAMDAYKRASGRMFPTWSEVLEVLRDLGYRKATEAGA